MSASDVAQGIFRCLDFGTQYRSAIYYADEEQLRAAESVRDVYNETLRKTGFRPITTEIAEAGPFYYAEDYHQQYLHKVPNGYCGIEGTGVTCPLPAATPVSEPQT